ncbi:hypothetical protein H4J59_18690 [Colwellia sp. MB02u-10]|uniref:hypothetical protein n=1 Tax=Colwellia sp. MB02u-10 TaxID=2759828 RepID=UPI0015F429F1|nr:hypothetical protein [Colwellia sp. MB02u-10]MBA6343020.1 hypothetical protein [Colwellia sp. MB02u-10]
MTDNVAQVSIVAPIPTAVIEPAEPLTLTQRIDTDEGLKAKRKLLTVVSLILLAISFSGAKVVEANTFIMKISFTNQNGIAYLLLLSIAFLMIRYYNYARPYHDELYKAWTKRMLYDDYFYSYHDYADDVEGLIKDLYPENLIEDIHQHHCNDLEKKYRCSWLLGRHVDFTWSEEHGHEQWATVNLMRIKNDEAKNKDKTIVKNGINLKAYFKILSCELKYQASSFFTHRENLDILAPYFLGCFSILSFIYNKKIIEILKGFSS